MFVTEFFRDKCSIKTINNNKVRMWEQKRLDMICHNIIFKINKYSSKGYVEFETSKKTCFDRYEQLSNVNIFNNPYIFQSLLSNFLFLSN